MLTRLTIGKLVVFLVLAVVVIGYMGVHYANVGKYFGAPGYYVVTADLPQAGGLYQNADVTYRGVSVGRVGALTLSGSGVQAKLDISDSAPPIPADTQAVVADLSAVGEQYLDLRPGTSGGPYLTADSVIGRSATSVPAPVTDLLSAVDGLANSLPKSSLQTLVNELYNGFNDSGPNLQRLITDSSGFTQAAALDITPTSQLITEGQTVLATQQADSAEIQQFATDGELFAHQLAGSDSDLRRLITAAPTAAQQVSALLADNDPNLGLTIANLLTASNIALPRQANLAELLTALPALAAAGNTIITANGGSFGLALTFFDPPPCTAGYQGTTYRNGDDTSSEPPVNVNARCASPPGTGIDVRGSQNHPKP